LILSDSTLILNPVVDPALNALACTSPENEPVAPISSPVNVALAAVSSLLIVTLSASRSVILAVAASKLVIVA
jgi:hypothetical protein